MPPPATNRTFWFNASDNDHLYLNSDLTGGNPADGQVAKSWDDEDAATEYIVHDGVDTKSPVWLSNGINGLGALDYDGTDDVQVGTGGGHTLGDVIANNAYTIFVAFYMEGAVANQANIYNNTTLVGDGAGGFGGIFLKSNGGTHTVHIYNWDGTADDVSKTISLNTPYVVMARHEGGTLYISINQGSESSVASGDTTTLTGQIKVSFPSTDPTFYNGRIGEILCYNAALSGADFTNAYTYMTDKWVSTAAGVLIPKVMFMKRRRPMSRARRPG